MHLNPNLVFSFIIFHYLAIPLLNMQGMVIRNCEEKVKNICWLHIHYHDIDLSRSLRNYTQIHYYYHCLPLPTKQAERDI